MTLLLTLITLIFFYACYKGLDIYWPHKTFKEAIITSKHTESYTEANVDHSGKGHEKQCTRYLLTLDYPRYQQTESVSQKRYSQAVVGQKIQVARCCGRFSKKLLRFDCVL